MQAAEEAKDDSKLDDLVYSLSQYLLKESLPVDHKSTASGGSESNRSPKQSDLARLSPSVIQVRFIAFLHLLVPRIPVLV